MKKIAVLFLSCLVFAASVQAQEAGFNNEALTATASTQGTASKLSTDRFGQQIPEVISPFMAYGLNDTAETGSTVTNIVATAHAVKVGDIVLFGITSAARGGASYVTSIATNSFTIAPPLRAAPSNGDFFYIGRPMPPSVDPANGILRVVQTTQGGAIAFSLEDAAAASGDPGAQSFIKLQSALTADTSAANDLGTQKGDLSGRTVTTMAVPEESFTSCSASATGTTDVAIKAAVASNRIYVTSISCVNTAGAVSTELAIDDGATLIDVGYVASTTLGESHWTKSYPVPLRGTANTALNVKPTTNASATRCCAQGYISTQ